MRQVSLIPLQGIRLTEDLRVGLGAAQLRLSTPALNEEYLSVYQELYTDANRYYSERPFLSAQMIARKREKLSEVEGSPVLYVDEPRWPLEEGEDVRLLTLAEEALSYLRVALFIDGAWLHVGHDTRYHLRVGMGSRIEREVFHFISLRGGVTPSRRRILPLHITSRGSAGLNQKTSEVVATAAASSRRQRAYLLLSEALESSRLEHLLVLAAASLETLLLSNRRREKKALLRDRVFEVTERQDDKDAMEALYTFRSDYVHKGAMDSDPATRARDLIRSIEPMLIRVFDWSVSEDLRPK